MIKKQDKKKSNKEKMGEDKKTENFLDVKKLSKDSSLPEYMLSSDVGLDLKAGETVSLYPMEQKAVKTGIAVKIPENHVGLIRDRAGIVSKMNVHTAAGTFDSAYTGEISIVLVNLGDNEVEIEKGMRIAQLVILPVTKVSVREVKSLSQTPRGEKSFGSTGIKGKIKILKKAEKNLSKRK